MQELKPNGTLTIVIDPLADTRSTGEKIIGDLVEFKNDMTRKPRNTFLALSDTGSGVLDLQTASMNTGGNVWAVDPQQFIFKQLTPLTQRKLAYPEAFTFNYSMSFYSITVNAPLPIVDTTFDLYLVMAIFDYNKLDSTFFTPLINPKLGSLVFNVSSGQFTFSQAATQINLLDAMDSRGIMSDYTTLDFNGTGANNSRSRVTKDQVKALLNSGSTQLGFSLCCDTSSSFITAQNKFTRFPFSYSFDYYATLADFTPVKTI